MGATPGSGFSQQFLISKEEFWFVVETCSIKLSRKACEELHERLDLDKTGSLELTEFLNWVYPGRELHQLQQKLDSLRRQISDDSDEDNGVAEDGYKPPKRPIWEMLSKNAVVLEFTIAQAYQPKIKHLKDMLLEKFQQLIVDLVVVIDPTLKHSCSRVVAKVGRGMVLWDATSMTPYRDDPFESKVATAAWLKKYVMDFMPDAIGAANVAVLKRRKREMKMMRGASRQPAGLGSRPRAGS